MVQIERSHHAPEKWRRAFVSFCALRRARQVVFFVVSARKASVRRDLVGLVRQQQHGAIADQVLAEQEHCQHQHPADALIALDGPHDGGAASVGPGAASIGGRGATASLPVSTLLFTSSASSITRSSPTRQPAIAWSTEMRPP